MTINLKSLTLMLLKKIHKCDFDIIRTFVHIKPVSRDRGIFVITNTISLCTEWETQTKLAATNMITVE